MKYDVTFYEGGQIMKTIQICSFHNAVQFAARELSKKMEFFVGSVMDMKVEAIYLAKREWAATIFMSCDEVFGITVQKEK